MSAAGSNDGLPVLGACLTALGLLGLIALAAEAAVAWFGPNARVNVYAGGIGALLASLCGLPFLAKLARMAGKDDETGRFWKLWGLGLVTRTGVGLLVAALLIYRVPPPVEAGVGTLALVYFLALMLETIWVAARLSRTDGK